MVEGVVAIIGIFFVPAALIILIVWFRSNAKHKRYQLQADLAAKALEKGLPVPTDLFVEPERKRKPLNTGIICIAIGIGIMLFLWLFFKSADLHEGIAALASIGFIPFLIGVAFVIIHFIEKGKNGNQNAA